jgi:hypothetical protein
MHRVPFPFLLDEFMTDDFFDCVILQ